MLLDPNGNPIKRTEKPIDAEVHDPALDVPDGETYVPPEGVRSIRPWKDMLIFDPMPAPKVDWLDKFEQQHFAQAAERVAALFRVQLGRDPDYNRLTDEERISSLFVVLTKRSFVPSASGIHKYWPIALVVKKIVMAAVEAELDPANNHAHFTALRLWNEEDKEYVPVGDEVTGTISLNAILGVLERFGKMQRPPLL